MKKFLPWLAAFLIVGGIAAFADTSTSPIFDDVTVNGTLNLNGVLGKFKSLGASPTINSCGTSPTVTGNDNSMLLTMGSGTLTTCTVSFSTPWAHVASCVAFPQNATAAATGTTVARISAVDASGITFTGSNLTSAAYYVLCW